MAAAIKGASRFTINGGHFVVGDVHNHTTVPPPSVHQPNVANPEVPFLRAIGDMDTESDIYTSQLLRQGRGFPLYVPEPRSFPEEYRTRGISMGDVGRVTSGGIFDFFFNIYLEADHPINANGVPKDFSPLPPYLAQDVFHLDWPPGDHVSTPSVQELIPELPLHFPGGDFRFTCIGPNGAVLALPHGAHLEKLENVESARRYAARNSEKWYKHVKESRGRDLANGSLYLVTGVEKSPSWGMASFQGVTGQNEFQLLFRATCEENGKYDWQRGTPARRKSSDGTADNQTTFLHGFSISLATGIWGRLFGDADLEICQPVNPQPENKNSELVPLGPQRFLYSWLWGFLGGGAFAGVISKLSTLSNSNKFSNPSRIINEYLLQVVPQASVAVTHDDDWRDILREDGAGSTAPDSSEFLKRICDQFKPTQEDGVIFLESKAESGLSTDDPAPVLCHNSCHLEEDDKLDEILARSEGLSLERNSPPSDAPPTATTTIQPTPWNNAEPPPRKKKKKDTHTASPTPTHCRQPAVAPADLQTLVSGVVT
ncbi:hypothetical protein C8J57DRAFT_426744 [Mycena rebaudengoi]|nr:hypothetical protein C8J57DRAFT_426744 [Mycena rebaudengoi]